jgi:hypothetical protein
MLFQPLDVSLIITSDDDVNDIDKQVEARGWRRMQEDRVISFTSSHVVLLEYIAKPSKPSSGRLFQSMK